MITLYCVIVSFVLISFRYPLINNTQLIVIQMKVIFFTILYDILMNNFNKSNCYNIMQIQCSQLVKTPLMIINMYISCNKL